ncbi:MAG TPA: phage tail sheath subtilisin-like domain-containing protein [Thermoanaerobaculia bacterium]|nr:phage tail sheath subtilisin-like domain-containing protein [Thermoanaerobaculia bacterium]
MPVTPTYPGVYIEEIPSGVRTIIGVATSITAFIGRAPRGPVDDPVTINSYGDFERTFGGLSVDSRLGFSVQDFYLNGGAQAIIVRVTGSGSATAAIEDAGHGLFLEATSEGAWANQLRARVDVDVLQASADALGVALADLFNLTIRNNATGEIETFPNVTFVDSPRRLDRILRANSQLARATDLGSAVVAHALATDVVWTNNTQSSPVTTLGANDAGLDDADIIGSENGKTGIYALEKADLFNLLVIPPYNSTGDVDPSLLPPAAVYCEKRRAMLLIDPPSDWTTKDQAKSGVASLVNTSKNAALYFPRIMRPNPFHDNMLEAFAPSGAVAGVFARTDVSRGVWKAPAGLEATLNGVVDLSVPLTDPENGELNPLGINCLRVRPAVGPTIWGARTRQGDDRLASEWKYVPVRRLALYLEESLYRGLQWVVFEPNDEPLWAQIRLNVGSFLQVLFRQGAFQGSTPQQAYFVKCDRETTTQNDIDRGIVNIVVGFAPLKPAEFVILKIQQIAGQIQT